MNCSCFSQDVNEDGICTHCAGAVFPDEDVDLESQARALKGSYLNIIEKAVSELITVWRKSEPLPDGDVRRLLTVSSQLASMARRDGRLEL